MFPAPVSAPIRASWRLFPLRLIPVRRRRCRPRRVRVFVVQEALVEPKPGAGASRRGAMETGMLVHAVIIIILVFAKRVIQLLRARCAIAAWHRAERDVIAGHCAVFPYGTATPRAAPAEEYAREDAEEDDDTRCAENPSL